MHLNKKEAENLAEDFLNIGARVKDKEHPFFYEIMGSLCLTMMYDIFATHLRQNVNEPINVQPLCSCPSSEHS